MGLTVSKYLDGPTFATATAVYDDATLTTKAADGWYMENNKYRRQSGGFLQPIVNCPSCNETCRTNGQTPLSPGEGTIAIDQGAGVYYVTFQTGSGIGVIRAFIDDLSNKAYGIQISHNSTLYNDWTDQANGFQSPPSGSNPVWLGDSTVGPTAGTAYTSQPTFTWDGAAWVSGSTVGYTVNSAGTNYTANPGIAFAPVPKTFSSNTTITLTVFRPPIVGMGDTTIGLMCPDLLPAIPYNSTVYGNAADACNATGTLQTFYSAGFGSSNALAQLNGFVFTNNFGTTALGAGYYKISSGGNGYMQVGSNGTILAIGSCPP